jgi:hypothetical protein
MKTKICEFNNGKFGIERKSFLFGREYQDLKAPNFWWNQGDKFFADCMGTVEECIKLRDAYKIHAVRYWK